MVPDLGGSVHGGVHRLPHNWAMDYSSMTGCCCKHCADAVKGFCPLICNIRHAPASKVAGSLARKMTPIMHSLSEDNYAVKAVRSKLIQC